MTKDSPSDPRVIDRWPVPKSHRFECCICRDQKAWQSDDYLVIRLTAPNVGDGCQWLGAHSSCLNASIGSGMIYIP
jgi:hypothetical protein